MAKGEAYEDFVEKFKPKLTTDDCYTPPVVFDAIAEWVAMTYGLDRSRFVRPFFPGGDFEAQEYGPDDVVVDNPPFSILARIIRFYHARGIRFFLFAPALTLTGSECVARLCTGASITYENGAVVNTSFVTNLEPADVIMRSEPELRRVIMAADLISRNEREQKKELPKYVYPPHVITAAQCNYLSAHDTRFTLRRKDAAFVRALDAQRAVSKSIFGGGVHSVRLSRIGEGRSGEGRSGEGRSGEGRSDALGAVAA